MTNHNLLRKSGGNPITVSGDATELTITEPVSDFVNFNEVIGSLNRLEKLSLYTTDLKPDLTESLDFLRGAKDLKFLAIGSMPKLQDCAAIADCQRLEWLVLTRNVHFDFRLLPSIASLRKLKVELPGNAALNLIVKAPQLTSLEVLGGFNLRSLENIGALKNLEFLRLWSGSLLSTAGLSQLARLRTLDLGRSKLRDTAELGAVTGLRKLELIGNPAITSLEFLRPGALECLTMLEIPQLDSLKPLQRLAGLREFCFGGKVLDNDLRPLVSLPSLKRPQFRAVARRRWKAFAWSAPACFKSDARR